MPAQRTRAPTVQQAAAAAAAEAQNRKAAVSENAPPHPESTTCKDAADAVASPKASLLADDVGAKARTRNVTASNLRRRVTCHDRGSDGIHGM
jgi:hypothetical protein